MSRARNAKSPARKGGVSPSRDPRLPAPGIVLRRECKGQLVEVRVLTDSFEWNGERYGSLSAVATKAYGCPSNGFAFFDLLPKPAQPEEPKPPPRAPAKRKAGRPIAPRRS